MKVQVYDYENGNETPRCVCDLRECFPDDDDPEYHLALDTIKREGRYWGGGGAAALFLLKPAKETA